MAVDTATKKEYSSQVADLKAKLSEIDKELAMYKKAMRDDKKLAPFFHIGSASQMLEQVHINIDMNDKSEEIMGVKNNSFLDNARKLIYKIFAELENVVTAEIDEPLDFNREKLDQIHPFTPKQRLNLYKHLKKTIQRLIDAYGPNTKWKWSFPEMWAKAAILTKNFIDFREIQAKRDPREPYYYDRQELMEAVKNDLFYASNEYRNKYELSTKSNNDLLYAIRLLEAIKRIASMFGDSEMVKKTKAGIDSYRSRIEESEDSKKKKAAAGKKKKKKKK